MLDLQNTIECFKYGIESAINGMNHHFRKKNKFNCTRKKNLSLYLVKTCSVGNN